MTMCVEFEFSGQFNPRRPAQPANQLKISNWANMANFHPIDFKLGAEVIYNLPNSI